MPLALPKKTGTGQSLVRILKNNSSLHFLFILIMELLAYRHLFSIFFLSDDFELLQRNMLWLNPSQGFFRPIPKLIMLSFHFLFGTRTFAFHLLSFLIHYANALLIYFILQKLMRNKPAALIGSALFVVNYLNSEAVFWISSINSILVTLFILLAINSFLNYLAFATTGYKKQSLAYLVLGLLTNENAIMLPALLFILYECYSKFKSKIRFADLLKDLTGHFIIIFAYVLVKSLSLVSNFRQGTLSFGYHVIRNLRFFILSIFTFNPFNDLPFVYIDTNLLNIFLQHPIKKLDPKFDLFHFYFPLLIGAIILAFFIYILFKGPAKLKYTSLAIIASTLPVVMLSSTNLPFGGYYRYPLRLMYLPSSLFVIFLALFLNKALLWLRKRSELRKYSAILMILVFSLLLSETIKTNGRNSDWLRASAITRSILGQFGKFIGSSPETRHIVLFNVPDNYQGAYIFRNGLAAAIKLYFPAAKVKIEPSKLPAKNAGKFKTHESGLIFLDCAGGKLTPIPD